MRLRALASFIQSTHTTHTHNPDTIAVLLKALSSLLRRDSVVLLGPSGQSNKPSGICTSFTIQDTPLWIPFLSACASSLFYWALRHHWRYRDPFARLSACLIAACLDSCSIRPRGQKKTLIAHRALCPTTVRARIPRGPLESRPSTGILPLSVVVPGRASSCEFCNIGRPGHSNWLTLTITGTSASREVLY